MSYFVKCVRVETKWFARRSFYVPMEYKQIDGKLYPLKDIEEMPTVWGYETEADAWKAIEAEEYEPYTTYRGYREDFHSDG